MNVTLVSLDLSEAWDCAIALRHDARLARAELLPNKAKQLDALADRLDPRHRSIRPPANPGRNPF